MVQISPWKVFLIILVCLYGILYTLPNLLDEGTRGWMKQNLPAWMPQNTINLGLDLRGGAHLLYEVDMEKVYAEQADMFAQEFRKQMAEKKIEVEGVVVASKGLTVTLVKTEDGEEVRAVIRKADPRLQVSASGDGKIINVLMDDSYIREVQDKTLAQVIEVVRRRVDEIGTTEPMIQRQGDSRVIIQVPGAKSEDLRRLIGKTAKLGFHLLGDQSRKGVGEMSLPFEANPLEKAYVKRRAGVTGDMLEQAQPTFDQNGQPVVSFSLNSLGARRFCDITRENVGQPFAIVLDEQIISAPRINEAICGGGGQISGDFSIQEATELALLLRAGALPAEMDVVEERTVGPSLGADSIEAGAKASLIGLVSVLVFMILAYGFFGILAGVALLFNVTLIMALLSSLQATLTLPGIAGIVLTIGMAVDANVLIFERIREEFIKGRSLVAAIDAGYSRALGTIIDSNLTTLIAGAILFVLGTGPIKGFAVTLAIGIITSYFSAVMITRLFVVLWLKKAKPKTLPM